MEYSVRNSAEIQARESRAVSIGLGGLLLSIVICIVVSLTSYFEILGFLVPILSLAVGGWFIAFVPQYFVSFSLWLWFVNPFVRRIIDFKAGAYDEDPIVMIAPYLVSALGFLSVMRHWKTLKHPVFTPLLIALGATTYGFILTLGFGSPVQAVKLYLAWSGPILLAMVVLIHWSEYPKYRSAVASTMKYALVVLGGYALIQYFIFPPWDKMWFLGAGMSSLGAPEPLKVRVFSMLNSPGPFATVVLAALALQFMEKGMVSKVAIGLGAVGLLLSSVRSAWAGFIVALIIALVRSDGALKKRITIILVLAIFVGVPAFMRSPLSTPIAEQVSRRTDSFENIENDGSLQARLGLYRGAASLVLKAPFGRGYAATAYDSGWISIFVHLGLVAGGLYAFALIRLTYMTIALRLPNSDSFAALSLAVALAFVFLMLSGSQHYGVLGTIMWLLFALPHAASFWDGATVEE